MKRMPAVAWKETLHLLRDPRSLVAALGLPVVLLLLYGYAVDFDLKQLRFVVVDQDRTASSRQLVELVRAVPQLVYSGHAETADEVERLFAERRASMGMILVPGFERALKERRPAPVQVLIDGADGSTAQIAQGYASGAVLAAGQRLIEREARAMGVPLRQLQSGFEVRPRVLYNPNLESRVFLVPGLVGLILVMLSASLTSGVVVRERERGSFELLAASPVSSAELIVGKLLPYLVLATSDVVLAVGMGWLVFGVVPQGNLLLLFALSLVFVLSALALGLFFSCVARTQQTAIQLSIMATVVPTMTLSGFAFPVRNMPLVLQVLAQLLPATHFMVISRAIILKGVGLAEIWPNVLAMTVLSLLLMRAAVRKFRKTL
ncbi:MAG: ABC transporter permease [Fimbriimonadaceae bacterium]|nr:ABC transporter permease [Fimbriimonadaceae bacterium]